MQTQEAFLKWKEAHSEVFQNYQFPSEELSLLLFQKLVGEQYDVGLCFGIDTSGYPTLLYTPSDKSTLEPLSNVFFTDHCWMVEPENIYNDWKNMPQLKERFASFLSSKSVVVSEISIENALLNCNGKNLDLDNMNISNLRDLRIPEHFPNLESLSLWGNNIDNPVDLLDTLSDLPMLKALWINGNPVADTEQVLQAIPIISVNLEILNSKFTSKWGEWALMFCSKAKNPENVVRIDLSDRGIIEMNEKAFEKFRNLYHIDVSGNNVDLSCIKTIIPSLHSIRCDNTTSLPEGLIFVNGYDSVEKRESVIIPDSIWDHLQPIGEKWALGDEIALSISHSLTPNVATMPVISPLNGFSYFVFWPVSSINPYDEICADLYPLIPLGAKIDPKKEPELKTMKPLSSRFVSSVITKRPIKVFTDIEVFAQNLHSDKFEIVKTPEEADLHWYGLQSVPDFETYYENKIFLNQIEGEHCLTRKDFLYETITEYIKPFPYLPDTYILTEPEQIEMFIQKHKELEAESSSAVWIVKAFNLSRANMMVVTSSLGEVLRHASIGPRLVQRYLWNPLNIFGQKFDLRFIILLKSVKPFELFAYNVFWPRLSPKKWALDDFDDYERHFTVMNYRAPTKVTGKTWKHFVEQFNIENPSMQWIRVLQNIYKSIGLMMQCGCQNMVQSPYTKGIFGVDVMLTNDYQPIILECNFQPDCKRACNLCPTFVDDVFEVLFTDQPVTNQNVTVIPLQ